MPQLDVTAAFDARQLAAFDLVDEAGATRMLARAFECYEHRDGWLEPAARIEILERLAERVRQRADELALNAAREGGKPLKDSKVEVERAIDGIETAAESIKRLVGTEVPMRITSSSAGRWAVTYREPRGVVLAISAFNHPFNLIVHQVVTAVAAGCPVIVKPAKATPMSCATLVSLLHESGLPQNWCQLLLCENEVTSKLVSDRRVAFMTFIGSAKVGWSLRSKLAPGANCALEHGGVAPAVLDETADLDDAIPLLLRAGFYHAGQVCVSTQRIYLHEDVASAFTERFVAGAEELVVGDPTLEETDVGPLIATSEIERIHEWVDEAVQGGGQLLCGGKRVGETCYAPTVVLNPPDNARLSREEVFGPVVAIYTYRDLDDAIRRANAPDSFFQASLFTNKLDVALDASRRLKGMAVMVNDHTAFRVDWMPFGGHQNSGLGRGGIEYSMEDMTIERMVVFRRA